jgi:hypothetical protein
MAGSGVVFAGTEPEAQPAATPERENSLDLFTYDSVYTFHSDFKTD